MCEKPRFKKVSGETDLNLASNTSSSMFSWMSLKICESRDAGAIHKYFSVVNNT